MAFLEALDNSSLWLIHDLFQSAFLDRLMPFISTLGNGGGIWVLICIILLFNKKTRMTGFAMAIAMLACYLGGNLFLKHWIARPRPYQADPTIQLLIPPSSEIYSFPSGHAMNAFSAATVLLLRRQRLGFIAMVLAVLIAFSRIYLMMHYPTDVGTGMAVGILSAWIACRIVKTLEQRQRFSHKSK